MTGIDQLGTYVPRYRIRAETIEDAWGQFAGRGISETAVPAADEDSLTMAHEACSRTIDASSISRSDLSALFVATTTPPMEEDPIPARLVSTLSLAEGLSTRQFTGSTRAGVEALVTGLALDEPALVVASDAPRGEPDSAIEHAAGGAAVALVLTPGASGTVEDHAAVTEPVPGIRFRSAGAGETTGLGITSYDRAAYLEGIGAAVDSLDVDPAVVDALACQAPDGTIPYRLTGRLDVDNDQIQRGTVADRIGDVGTASPLLGLAAASEDGAKTTLLAGYGSGSATAVAISGTIPVATGPEEGVVPAADNRVDLSYGEYLRMRGEITGGEPDGGGAYVSVPSWKRTIPQRHRFVAGRCEVCGSLAFPPGGACGNCGTLDEYEKTELPGTGTVEATTVIGAGGAPPEFVEQQARSGSYTSAVVALDGPDGETVSIPTQVVPQDEPVEIGDRVAATIRRIYTQEGVIRYGFKMRPRR